MEDGPIGLSGVHAVSPVAEVPVKGAERVTTHHRNMAGTNVSVGATTWRIAMNSTVLVSLLTNKVLGYIKHRLWWVLKPPLNLTGK